MSRRWLLFLSALGLILVFLASLVLLVPPIQERVYARITSLSTQIKYFINPPQKVVFVPQGEVDKIVQETMAAFSTSQAALFPTNTSTPSVSPTQVPEPTSTATPIPMKVTLDGVQHEYQKFNNCGPANLAMALGFWGWKGNQMDVARSLRPDERDKNVSPQEMVAFTEQQAGLSALVRFGGDLEILKKLIAGGFPVIIEMGHDPAKDYWMGHYLLLNGYDDERGRFTGQDSLIMPDFRLPYDEIQQHWWRDFNYVYLVVFPEDRQEQVTRLLGDQMDIPMNFQATAEEARRETATLKGRDLYFAWYNLGSSLVALQDYPGAAAAYDQAFSIYTQLPEEDRPYRMLWYQTGPYPAYYYSGRYQDVIDLANTTFSWVGEAVLEETFYWRGMAYLATGAQEKAIHDFEKAYALNPSSTEAILRLQELGVR